MRLRVDGKMAVDAGPKLAKDPNKGNVATSAIGITMQQEAVQEFVEQLHRMPMMNLEDASEKDEALIGSSEHILRVTIK